MASTEDKSEEAREIERLSSLDDESKDLQLCPCIFTPFSPGVPLANPELIQKVQQREEMFKSDAYARINELLPIHKKEASDDEKDVGQPANKSRPVV
jgi:hypothetical protein